MTRARARLGLLVPFTNTNFEPDMALMMPPDITLHSARMGGYDEDENDGVCVEDFAACVLEAATAGDDPALCDSMLEDCEPYHEDECEDYEEEPDGTYPETPDTETPDTEPDTEEDHWDAVCIADYATCVGEAVSLGDPPEAILTTEHVILDRT